MAQLVASTSVHHRRTRAVGARGWILDPPVIQLFVCDREGYLPLAALSLGR